MPVRAKFHLDSVLQQGEGFAEKLTFRAVKDDGTLENDRYHRYSPNGVIEIDIDNPTIKGKFKPGQEYYVDFTKVPEQTPVGGLTGTPPMPPYPPQPESGEDDFPTPPGGGVPV